MRQRNAKYHIKTEHFPNNPTPSPSQELGLKVFALISECTLFPLYQLTITVSHATRTEDNYKLL